jgi:uncharacterized protein YqjF (DUF2071 family)
MALFLKANWEHIIMANYAIDAKILLPFLPKGVELDLYNNKAYISLVGFMFKNTKIFGVPIPKLGTFEEINLRFYVKRTEGNLVKRGVVFINETIPYPIVAWVANKLYKEHYTVVPTKHSIKSTAENQKIEFNWLVNKKWQSIYVEAKTASNPMVANSLEEFIYQHYYGYTKVNAKKTEEYKLQHPSWHTYKVTDYTLNCDFEAMYGKAFAALNFIDAETVFMAKGSEVGIEWKRNKLNFEG